MNERTPHTAPVKRLSGDTTRIPAGYAQVDTVAAPLSHAPALEVPPGLSRPPAAPGQALSAPDILRLQHTAGNRAVQRLLRGEPTRSPARAAHSLIQRTPVLSAGTVAPTIQCKTALVSGKAHTRIVNKPLAGSEKKQARQINRASRSRLFNRFDEVELDDDFSKHIVDEDKNVLWYRIKGTDNEYIRGSKVLALTSPQEFKTRTGKTTDSVELDDPSEGAEDMVGYAEELVGTGIDEPMVEVLRGLDLKENRGEELTDSELKLQTELTIGEGVAWTGSSVIGMVGGIMGMAAALKDLTDDEATTWDKVEAAFNLITSYSDTVGSTMGAIGGISSLVNSGAEEGSKVAATSEELSSWGFGWQAMWSTLTSAVKTIKSVVDLVRMIAESKRDGAGPGRDAWMKIAAELLENALETAKGVIYSIRTIYELVSGNVTTAFENVLPGFDIAIAGVKSIFQGYYLAMSGHQWWLMHKEKRALKTNLKDEGYDKNEIKSARKYYTQHEATIANYDSLIKHNDKAIEKRYDKIFGMSYTGKHKERNLKRGDKYTKEIDELIQENIMLKRRRQEAKSEIDEYEKGNMKFDFSDSSYAPSTGETKLGLHPTRMEVAELDLAGELADTNRKRVVRQSIHIGTNLAKIAGSIVTLVAGPGAPAGVATKAAAAGIEVGLPIFRSLKQFGRNQAAKNQAKGKKGVSQKIFNSDKSTVAKLGKRKKHAVQILLMVAGLNKLMPTSTNEEERARQRNRLKGQARRVENFIKATGCRPQNLYKANGKPDEQIKILVAELSKREFGA